MHTSTSSASMQTTAHCAISPSEIAEEQEDRLVGV